MARKKGSKNNVGANAKENILAVFTRLGGTAEMARWAKDNLTEFYRLYAKLVPTHIEGKIDHKHVVETGDAASLTERLDKSLQARSVPSLQ
jgi:hypothetical protein